MKKFFRILFKILIWALVLAVLLVFAVWAFLQTPPGKRALVHIIQNAANDPATGSLLVISSLEGSFPQDLRVPSIIMSDRNGPYLEVKNVHFQWSPLSALTGTLHIETLSVDSVALHRVPAPSAKAPPAPAKPFSMPHIPLVDIDSIRLPSITLDAPVAGVAEAFAASGHADATGYHFALTSTSGPATSLTLALQPGKTETHANLAFSEAAGGLIGHMAKLPATATVAAALDATAGGDGSASVKTLTASAASLAISANGHYNAPAKTVAGTFSVAAGNLADFAGLAGTELSGALQAQGSADGPLTALKVKLTAASPALTYGTHTVVALDLAAPLTVDAATPVR